MEPGEIRTIAGVCIRLPDSSPQVTFIIFDPVSVKESAKFFLKGGSPVVFSLLSHVVNHSRQIRFADGKCTISILPPNPTKCRERVMNPF